MSAILSGDARNAQTGFKTITLGWDGGSDPVGASTYVELGYLPANCILRLASGTVVEAEGSAGNCVLCYSTDDGSTLNTLLTVDANGTVGTNTVAPTNILATGAVATAATLLNTSTSTSYSLWLKGSADLDSARIVFILECFFGPTTGTDGTAEAFLP